MGNKVPIAMAMGDGDVPQWGVSFRRRNNLQQSIVKGMK